MDSKELPFKNVYCHGMLTAIDGVKMSKSLGNIISPYEITDKYGADTMRFYLCSISAGQNISFSWDDIQQRYRTINVLWNIHNYLTDFLTNEKIDLEKVMKKDLKLEIEDEYILSFLNSAKRDITLLLDSYELDKACNLLNELILVFSRDYIKMIRERAVSGTDEQKESLAQTLFVVLKDIIIMSNIYTPFISEQIYQNLKQWNVLTKESITFESWISFDEKKIKPELVEDFDKSLNIITGILGARELSGLGVRWPVKKVLLVSKEEIKLSEEVQSVIKEQTNVKELEFRTEFDYEYEVKPNYKNLSSLFGEKTSDAAKEIDSKKQDIIIALKKGEEELVILDQNIKLKDCLNVEEKVNKPFYVSDTPICKVVLDSTRNDDLDSEGYAREIIRRVQDMRKKNDFTKLEKISLNLKAKQDVLEKIKKHTDYISFKVGAKTTSFEESNKAEYQETFKIKGYEFEISFDKLKK